MYANTDGINPNAIKLSFNLKGPKDISEILDSVSKGNAKMQRNRVIDRRDIDFLFSSIRLINKSA